METGRSLTSQPSASARAIAILTVEIELLALSEVDEARDAVDRPGTFDIVESELPARSRHDDAVLANRSREFTGNTRRLRRPPCDDKEPLDLARFDRIENLRRDVDHGVVVEARQQSSSDSTCAAGNSSARSISAGRSRGFQSWPRPPDLSTSSETCGRRRCRGSGPRAVRGRKDRAGELFKQLALVVPSFADIAFEMVILLGAAGCLCAGSISE